MEPTKTSDPWAVGDDVAATRAWLSTPAVEILWVGGLGSFVVAARTLGHGNDARRASIVLMCVGLLVAVAMSSRQAARVRVSSIALAATLALLVVEPSIGRAPVAVTLLSVATVHLALFPWPTHIGLKRLPVGRAKLAVPLIVAAELTWYRTGSVLAAIALLVAAVAVVGLYVLHPSTLGVAERLVALATRRIADGLSTIVFAFVSLLVYLPGVVAGAAEKYRRRRSRVASGWIDTAFDMERTRRDSRYPFASPNPIEARRRQVVGLIAVTALAGFVFWRISVPVHQVRPNNDEAISRGEVEDPPVIFGREFAVDYSSLPAYAGVDWADQLQIEEAGVPDVETFRGRFVNLREGRRVTIEPPQCACPTRRVWFTGGSAVWGVGQRDEHTIASELVRGASAHDLRMEVDNMGMRGSVIGEQVSAVEERLDNGEEPPDLIVFHIGFNETGVELGSLLAEFGGEVEMQMPSGVQGDLDIGNRLNPAVINDRVEEYLESGIGEETGRIAAANIRREQRRMARISERYGVGVMYFFQPDAFVTQNQLDPYKAISHLPTRTMLESPMAVALDVAAAELRATQVIDLRPVFSDDHDQVFLGLVHHNEVGASRIAEAMLPHLLGDFE